MTPSEPTVRLRPLRTSIMQNAVIWREGGVYHAWKAQRRRGGRGEAIPEDSLQVLKGCQVETEGNLST